VVEAHNSGTILGRGPVAAFLSRSARHRPGREAELLTWPDLLPELERSRRYDRCFTLLRLSAPVDVERRDRLAACFRSTDRCWTSDDAVLYVLIPELAGDEVASLLTRLHADAPGTEDLDLRTATFPTDGLTLAALLARLDDPTLVLPEPAGAEAGSTRDDVRSVS
jgi:hypothetical protein